MSYCVEYRYETVVCDLGKHTTERASTKTTTTAISETTAVRQLTSWVYLTVGSPLRRSAIARVVVVTLWNLCGCRIAHTGDVLAVLTIGVRQSCRRVRLSRTFEWATKYENDNYRDFLYDNTPSAESVSISHRSLSTVTFCIRTNRVVTICSGQMAYTVDVDIVWIKV